MCSPTALIGISLLTTVAGIAANNSAANAQTKQYEKQAEAQAQAYALRNVDRAREQARALGTARAQFGASGVDPSAGTTGTVYDQQIKEFAYAGFGDQMNTENQVDSLNSSAKANVKSTTWKNVGSLLEFGSSAASIGSGAGWFSSGTGYGTTGMGKTTNSGFSPLGVTKVGSGRIVGGV